MHRIPLWDEWVLLLTPRWGDVGQPGQTVLLVLLYLIPLTLSIWLYRYEMRRVKPSTGRWLLLWRSLALVLIASLVALEPTVGLETPLEQPGRVILAVDVSKPMRNVDPQREPVEKLKLARALKLAGDICPESQLDDWIDQYENKKSIRFVAADEFPGDAKRRRREEADRKKMHDEVCKRVDELSRADTVKQLLSPDGMRLLARIGAKHKIEVIGFAGDVQDVKPEALDELYPRLDGAKKDAEPGQRRYGITNLGLPFDRAIERSGEGRGKVLGVIVLSSGQHSDKRSDDSSSPSGKAATLKKHDIPVYPLAIGSDRPVPDAAVVAVVAPSTVFKEVDAPIKVRLRVTGLKPQKVKVLVHRPDEEDRPLAEREIEHDGSPREYFESFHVRLDKAGRETVQVTVKPLGEDVKEVNTENNRQTVLINVADETSRVLLVDGEGRWEFHYLYQALLRDRTMKVKSVLFEQPRLNKIPEQELAKINHAALKLPPLPEPEKGKERDPGKDPLNEFDCIILGDVLPHDLGPVERQRLERYVADRGGTLVILAGKRAMPMSYLTPSPAAPVNPKPDDKDKMDPLLKLLPIELPRVVDPVNGFPVTLTEEGKDTDFLKMEVAEKGGDPRGRDASRVLEESLRRWAEMPRHHWGVVGKAKPGATVLAYTAGDEKDLKPEEKRKREQESALFVRHNYGLGRVFYVGVDSTWRYRYRVGDLYHHRFWSQTIRWAATDKPLVGGNANVRFGAPQAIYREDEPVTLTVRLTEEIATLPPNLQVRAHIIRKNEDSKETIVATVEMKPRPLQPRVLDGQVRDLPEGKYEIELEAPELAEKLQSPDGKAGPLRATFNVVSTDTVAPSVRQSMNSKLLKELAEKNELGKYYTPESASELIEKLTAEEEKKKERIEYPLWLRWETLAVLLTLLTFEWALRKWTGLP